LNVDYKTDDETIEKVKMLQDVAQNQNTKRNKEMQERCCISTGKDKKRAGV